MRITIQNLLNPETRKIDKYFCREKHFKQSNVFTQKVFIFEPALF